MLSYTEPAVSVEEADDYAGLRAWTNWIGDDASKEGALRRSQDYIASTYNSRWKTEWENILAPDEVKYAIIEGARRELATPGSLNPDVVLATARKRVKVEGAVEVEYAVGSEGPSAESMRPIISMIDNLLAPFIRTLRRGSTVNTIRV